ncbi:hypothetical protein TNCV_4137041 [Trichonephila clavipes]|nr:hypothetical protein TNCV_4137041 [Trichonephila clavipes]
MISSMDELNLDQAAQDINKKEFQLECVRLEAFVAATDPGCKKNSLVLTLSKYNELNGQVTLSEWMKTAPSKKSSMPNQLAHEERACQILDGLMTWKKISLFGELRIGEHTSRKKTGLEKASSEVQGHP